MNLGLIEFGPTPSIREAAVEEMRKFAPPKYADWLADAVLSLGPLPAQRRDEEPRLPSHFTDACYGIQEAFRMYDGNEEGALLYTLLFYMPQLWRKANPREAQAGDERQTYVPALSRCIKRWKASWGLDDWSDCFRRSWVRGLGPAGDPDNTEVAARVLVEAGLVAPEKIIDLRASGNPPETLRFWFKVLGPKVVDRVIRVLGGMKDLPPDKLGELVLGGVLHVLKANGTIRPSSEAAELARELVKLVQFLQPDPAARVDPIYLHAYLEAVDRVCANAPECLPEKDKRTAASWIRRAMGRARQAARGELDSEDAGLELVLLTGATRVLARLEGLWAALNGVILVLRALRTQVVATDLDMLADVPAVPGRWRWIGQDIMNLMHTFARREQDRDRGLEAVREQFVRFCLDRLRTKERGDKAPDPASLRNEDMVEPNHFWRSCYVRAVRELRANPENRGHHVLHWSSRHDPSLDVREAARIAYGEMDKGSRIPSDMSPRRLIFAALWWLRQAHLRALGIEIDEQGARRTRMEELRMTAVDGPTDNQA